MNVSTLLLVTFSLFAVAACTPAPELDTSSSPSPEVVSSVKTGSTSVAPSLAETPTPVTKTANCHFTLGFDAWEPYQYAEVGGNVAGLDIELVATVVHAMSCEISYQQGTWVELLAALKAGKIDILLGASKTKAREEFALFSDAYRMEEFSLYIRKDDERYVIENDVDSFVQSGGRVGIVEDYYYGAEVAVLLAGSATSKSFVPAIMGELNIARLLDDDIDGFLEDSFVGASMLRRKALSNYIVAQGITIQTGNAYVMFSKKNVDLEKLSRFNTQLNQVKYSQTYADIVDKYSH
jgi:polar amino acid transport system substrate-binding protein